MYIPSKAQKQMMVTHLHITLDWTLYLCEFANLLDYLTWIL